MVIIICEQCGDKFEHSYATRKSNNRRFCTTCVKIRKNQVISESNEYRSSKVGRPLLLGNKIFKSKDSNSIWETSDDFYSLI